MPLVSRANVSLVAVCAVLILFPLWLGGISPYVSPLFFLLALVGLLGQMGRGRPLAVPLATYAFLLLAFVGLLQISPLPEDFARVLSPRAYEIWNISVQSITRESARVLSLDRAETALEILRNLGYAMFIIVIAGMAENHTVRGRLVLVAVMVGTVIALVGLCHRALAANLLFGFFKFQEAAPPLLTPFGNTNHLAGFLTLPAVLSLDRFLSRARRKPGRVLYLLAFFLMGVTIVLSLSRGGIVFFVLSVLAYGVLTVRRKGQRRDTPSFIEKYSLFILAFLLVVAVSLSIALDAIVSEVQSADSLEKLWQSKISAWPELFSAALAYWPVGMGLSAFSSGFTQFQNHFPNSEVTHAENIILSLLAEVGLIPALVVMGVFGVAFYRGHRRSSSTQDDALLAGVLGVGLHDLFDFSLAYVPTASFAVLALGVLSRPSRDGRVPWASFIVVWPRHVRILVPAAMLVFFSLFAPFVLRARPYDEQRVRDAISAGQSADEIHKLVKDVISDHAGSGRFHALLAYAYEREKKYASSLSAANRALFLRSTDPEAHRAAARALLALGHRSQALMEYRAALDSHARSEIILEAVDRCRTAEECLVLTEVGRNEAGSLQDVYGLLEIEALVYGHGRGDVAVKMLELIISDEIVVDDERRKSLLYTRLATRYRQRSDLERALTMAQTATRIDANQTGGWVELGYTLSASGRLDEALSALDLRLKDNPADVGVVFVLAELLSQKGEFVHARQLLAKSRIHLQATDEFANLYYLEGFTYERERLFVSALSRYRQAITLSPRAFGYRLREIEVLVAATKLEEAKRALSEFESLEPDHWVLKRLLELKEIIREKQAQADVQRIRATVTPQIR